jgi:glyoxylase-like metal-dependent hydrolase (beta-lactamase superfamily II)
MGDRFAVGSIEAEVLFSPGHTRASVTYLFGDAAFVHDTLLMPDYGTARCDFPGGDARQLWRTIQSILTLRGDTRLFVGHDYMPGGRAPAWESTVAEQRARNIHLRQATTEQEFVALRERRDAELPLPKLILHALQVNIAGGRLPPPEDNGRRYLKLPLDAFPGARWD